MHICNPKRLCLHSWSTIANLLSNVQYTPTYHLNLDYQSFLLQRQHVFTRTVIAVLTGGVQTAAGVWTARVLLLQLSLQRVALALRLVDLHVQQVDLATVLLVYQPHLLLATRQHHTDVNTTLSPISHWRQYHTDVNTKLSPISHWRQYHLDAIDSIYHDDVDTTIKHAYNSNLINLMLTYWFIMADWV